MPCLLTYGLSVQSILVDLSKDLKVQNNIAAGNPTTVQQMEIIMEREHRSNPYWPIVENANGNKIFEE
jgi:hypothetical protein